MTKDQIDALKDSLNRLDSRLDAVERKDAWSPEARAAAAEARKSGGSGGGATAEAGSPGWHSQQAEKKSKMLAGMMKMKVTPAHQPAHERDVRQVKKEIEEHKASSRG